MGGRLMQAILFLEPKASPGPAAQGCLGHRIRCGRGSQTAPTCVY